MPDDLNNNRFTPSRSYDIKLIIKNKDYSNDLMNVQIINSLNSIYEIIKLDLFIDVRIILSEIKNDDDFKLIITPIGNIYGQQKEKLEIELIYMQAYSDIPVKSNNYSNLQVDRTIFKTICIPKKPFRTMSTLVNKVFFGKKIYDVINELFNEINTGASIDLDNDNINDDIIDQIIIPPITFSKAIKYLDNQFGIFKGIMNMSCSYDNKIQIYNLNKKMNKDIAFTVYHLAVNDKNNKQISSDTIKKDNVYITYDILNLTYNTNMKSSFISKNIKFISKPTDELYYIMDKDFDDIVSNYSLLFSTQNNKIEMNDNYNRTRYYTINTGYNKSDKLLISNISKYMANMTSISFRIERSFNIIPFIKTGMSIKFNSSVSEFTELTGKYILQNSIITFNRSRNWEMQTKIKLIRSNRDR